MDPAPLVDQPNIGVSGIFYEQGDYVRHRFCAEWRGMDAKKKTRQPMFVSTNGGAIGCELCGRRVSRRLKKILLKNCGLYHDTLDGRRTTYYQFFRDDLAGEGLEGGPLIRRIQEESP
jgi:hypothetical protein